MRKFLILILLFSVFGLSYKLVAQTALQSPQHSEIPYPQVGTPNTEEGKSKENQGQEGKSLRSNDVGVPPNKST